MMFFWNQDSLKLQLQHLAHSQPTIPRRPQQPTDNAMACRSCSTGLGWLPRRLTAAAPRRPNWNSLDSNTHSIVPVPVPSSILSARCDSSAPTSLSPATHRTTPGRPPRRALHTTAPRAENFLKKALVGRIAQSLAKGQSSYYVYGATEQLYKLCAAQADYTIDPAARKAGTLQTTADGEEIGASQGGPWHDGTPFLSAQTSSTAS